MNGVSGMNLRTIRGLCVGGAMACLLAGLLPGLVGATTTPRVIDNITADWPNTGYAQAPRISADGEVVAFQGTTDVPFAVPSPGILQVFATDLASSQIEQVSVNSSGIGIFNAAWPGGLSATGRFIAFTGQANSIPGNEHVFVRDRVSGVTEQIDVADGGGVADGSLGNGDADISDDGRFVAFSSTATNLLPSGEDTNGKQDVFVRDRQLGTTTRVSVGPAGLEADGHSFGVVISGDGSTVAFTSTATNLLGPGGDTNGFFDTYAVDLGPMTAELISVADNGDQANAQGSFAVKSINENGTVVAFDSVATNLVAGDTNNGHDVFVRDRDAGTTIRASVRDDGSQPGVAGDSYSPVLNGSGTRVAFTSTARLVPEKATNHQDVFVRDLAAGTTELISRTSSGSGGDSISGELNNTLNLSIDASGDLIAFGTFASDLSTPGASPQSPDVMLSGPVPADGDGDGVVDNIDTGNGTFSDGSTFGSIVTVPAGLAIHITDAVGAENGIHVVVTGSGTQKVQLSMCGGLTVRLAVGTDTILTCGSVIVEVAPGSPPVEVVVGDGLAVISVPAGAEAEISATPSGGFTVENVSGGSVAIVVDGTTSTVNPGGTLSGNAWHFDGFKTPIDNGGVLNAAKAGKSVPIKWRLTDASGAPVTNLTTAHLSVVSLSCPQGATADQVEEYTSGSSGLINDGNGTYHMNWATPSSYANSCKTLRLDVGDGVYHTALFKFTK